MKKNLLLALMVLSTFTSLANARFFLGIDGGYSMDKVDVKIEDETVMGVVTKPGSFTKDAYLGNGYLFNINLGTEHHFDKNNYVGFRWFLGLGYGRTTLINQSDKSIQYPSSIIEANLGADLLLDVIKFGKNSLGVFGGVEGGVNVVLSDDYRYLGEEAGATASFSSLEFLAQARVGLSLFLAEHHRIEFVTKIPVYTLTGPIRDSDNINRSYFYKPLQFMLGYKYIF